MRDPTPLPPRRVRRASRKTGDLETLERRLTDFLRSESDSRLRASLDCACERCNEPVLHEFIRAEQQRRRELKRRVGIQ